MSDHSGAPQKPALLNCSSLGVRANTCDCIREHHRAPSGPRASPVRMRTCLGNARLFRRCSPAACWWELLWSGGTRVLCGIFGSVAKRRIALKSKELLLGGGENTISFYLKRGVITSIRYLPLQPCLSGKCLETVCMCLIGHRCPSNSCSFRAGYQNKVETILPLKEGVFFSTDSLFLPTSSGLACIRYSLAVTRC